MVLYAVGADEATGFVQVTADHRVAVWDTASGKLKTSLHEKSRLATSYSCIAVGESKSKSKKQALVALGSTSGKLSVWDLVRGESLHSGLTAPGSNASDALSDVAFSPDCKRLYSASADSKYVFEFDLEDGTVVRKFRVGRHGATKLCVSGDGKYLLTASLSLLLWDLETGKKVKKFAGHTSPVRALAFSAESSHFVSCAEDRLVHLWNCDLSEEEQGKKSKRAKRSEEEEEEKKVPFQRSPDMVFSAPTPPVWLSFESLSSSKGSLRHGAVIGCCEERHACVWSVDLQSGASDKGVGRQPDCVMVNRGTYGDVMAALCNIESNKGAYALQEVILVRKSPLRPVFQRISLSDKGEYLKRIELDDVTAEGRFLRGALEEKTTTGENPAEDMEDDNKKKSKDLNNKVHIVKGASSNIAKPTTGEAPDGSDDEMTMGERIQALNDKLSTHLEQVSEDLDASAAGGKAGKKRPREEPNSVSLSSVLEQALQSNDNQLLEVCLRNSDRKVVMETVARLSSARVLQFVNTIVQKFESRPARGPALIIWIKALLDQHASYLVTVPDLAESLSGLHQIIETRLVTFSRFLKLQGRLEFVLSQVALRASRMAEAEEDKAGASVVYDESAFMEQDEDEDEDEDEEEEGEEKVVNGDAASSDDEEEVEERKPESKQEEAESEEEDDDEEEEEEEKPAKSPRRTRSKKVVEAVEMNGNADSSAEEDSEEEEVVVEKAKKSSTRRKSAVEKTPQRLAPSARKTRASRSTVKKR